MAPPSVVRTAVASVAHGPARRRRAAGRRRTAPASCPTSRRSRCRRRWWCAAASRGRPPPSRARRRRRRRRTASASCPNLCARSSWRRRWWCAGSTPPPPDGPAVVFVDEGDAVQRLRRARFLPRSRLPPPLAVRRIVPPPPTAQPGRVAKATPRSAGSYLMTAPPRARTRRATPRAPPGARRRARARQPASPSSSLDASSRSSMSGPPRCVRRARSARGGHVQYASHAGVIGRHALAGHGTSVYWIGMRSPRRGEESLPAAAVPDAARG